MELSRPLTYYEIQIIIIYNREYKHKDEGKGTEPTGEYFNKPGHSGVSDMRIQIIEKLFVNQKNVRKIHENMYIKQFQAET